MTAKSSFVSFQLCFVSVFFFFLPDSRQRLKSDQMGAFAFLACPECQSDGACRCRFWCVYWFEAAITSYPSVCFYFVTAKEHAKCKIVDFEAYTHAAKTGEKQNIYAWKEKIMQHCGTVEKRGICQWFPTWVSGPLWGPEIIQKGHKLFKMSFNVFVSSTYLLFVFFCLWKPHNSNYLTGINTLWFNCSQLMFTQAGVTSKQLFVLRGRKPKGWEPLARV